ncbi:MAG: dienelactone hydrolase family protein [Candidatus Cardinium sp.]|nr:dienelactone hydrolase family protein [Candidatus Cardinium sp.]
MHALTYPEVYSKTLPAKKLVVLLHGIGADGNDWIPLAHYMQNNLTDCHFIAPHGIEPYESAPYGRQWFSLLNRDPAVMQPLLARNAPRLMDSIQQKQLTLQLTNQDTVIMGFSQGAMMGIYLTLIQQTPFLATIAFSGLLIAPPACLNTTTPIYLIHGILDNIITVDAVDQAMQYLAKWHIPHNDYKLPHLAHSIDHRGLQQAIDCIHKASPGLTVAPK